MRNALSQENPIKALRELVLTLNAQGIGKATLLAEFHDYDKFLRDHSRNHEADVLEDVIDMMTGYYPGCNLDLK